MPQWAGNVHHFIVVSHNRQFDYKLAHSADKQAKTFLDDILLWIVMEEYYHLNAISQL